MSIVVTGATGHFGRLTVEALRRRGFPAEQIIATGRRIEALGDLADQGISVRRADYSDGASLLRHSTAPLDFSSCPAPKEGSASDSTPM
jgi:uncharacterized protein YbjT (DUF2867 family)